MAIPEFAAPRIAGLPAGDYAVSIAARMEQTPAKHRTKIPLSTWIGLFLSLFGMLLVRQVANHIWPDASFTGALAKEVGMWLLAIVILLIVKRGERLPFRSVGIGTRTLGSSLGFGLLLGIVCLVVGAVIVALTHYNGGESGKAMQALPTWLIALIVARAGVVEELCYRGYAIERLQAHGLPPWLAATVPLIIFGIGHWTGGWANIVIALVLGGILAASYIWRRDLIANMIGHWLVDFVGNVLPRLFR